MEEKILKFLKYLQENRNKVLGGIAVILVITLLTTYFFVQYFKTQKKMWEQLSVAQIMMFNNQFSNALNILDNLIQKFGTNKKISEVYLLKAIILHTQRQIQQADDVLQLALQKNRNEYLTPVILYNLAIVNEDLANYLDAQNYYKKLLDKFPEHFFIPKVYEALGRIAELTGNTSEAKIYYEKLITLFPQTQWSEKAKFRLTQIIK